MRLYSILRETPAAVLKMMVLWYCSVLFVSCGAFCGKSGEWRVTISKLTLLSVYMFPQQFVLKATNLCTCLQGNNPPCSLRTKTHINDVSGNMLSRSIMIYVRCSKICRTHYKLNADIKMLMPSSAIHSSSHITEQVGWDLKEDICSIAKMWQFYLGIQSDTNRHTLNRAPTLSAYKCLLANKVKRVCPLVFGQPICHVKS